VTTVRAPDGGNPGRMTGMRQPIVDRGANLAALDGRLARAMMARNQQQNAVAAGD